MFAIESDSIIYSIHGSFRVSFFTILYLPGRLLCSYNLLTMQICYNVRQILFREEWLVVLPIPPWLLDCRLVGLRVIWLRVCISGVVVIAAAVSRWQEWRNFRSWRQFFRSQRRKNRDLWWIRNFGLMTFITFLGLVRVVVPPLIEFINASIDISTCISHD